MTNPSPAAQAVRDALEEWISSDFVRYELRKAAIVLRAAADQVVPGDGSRRANEIRDELLAIAAELEAQ